VAMDEVSNGAWRVRDPIHSILGRDGNVHSETGMTIIASALSGIDGGDDNEAKQQQQQPPLKNITEEILTPMLPSPTDLAEFVAKKHFTAASALLQGVRDGTDYNLSCQQRGKININYVHAAFNAAAYSIVRGNQRAAMEKKNQMEEYDESRGKEEVGGVTADDGDNNNDSETTDAVDKQYEPPLLQAFESIRLARMKSLAEASGKSVPSFLKKNTTIPWFHTPVDTTTTTTSGGGNTSDKKTSSIPVPMEGVTSSKDSAIAQKKKTKVQSSSSVSNADAAATAAALAIKKKRTRDEQPDNVPSSGDGNKTGTKSIDVNKTPVKKRSIASGTSQQQQQQPPSPTAVVDDVKTKSTKSPSSENEKETAIVKSTPTSTKTATTPKRSPSSTTSSTSKKSKAGSPSKGANASSSTNSAKQYSVNTTRAILCATASLVFEKTTPDYVEEGISSIDPRNIPQNTVTTVLSSPATTKATKKDDFNMDTILEQASLFAKRAIEQANNAAHSSDRRREFLMDSSLARVGMGYDALSGRYYANMHDTLGNSSTPLVVSNPFANDGGDDTDMTDCESEDDNMQSADAKLPSYDMSNDKEWTTTSKPRLMAILNTGAGNAILHDREWTCRAFRVANLLQSLAVPHPTTIPSTQSDKGFVHWNDVRLSGKSTPSLVRGFPNYGPHLIITPTGQDFDTFVAVFNELGNAGIRVSGVHGDNSHRDVFKTIPEEVQLRALPYHGDDSRRRRLRKHFTNSFDGLPSSTYHVVVTTYADFVEDYTHFCQVPFQAVIMDDGMSWLGCAHYDPQGDLGKVWNSATWSKAGAYQSQPNSHKNDCGGDVDKKSKLGSSKKESESMEENKLHIGLTARHRILIASTMHARYRGQLYKAPVPGLLSFLTPQFTDVIRDDWERCKVYNCKKSMEHIRSLVARSVVVYFGGPSVGSLSGLLKLSCASMNGELPEQPGNVANEDDELDEWVKRQKIVQTRKFAAAWFRPLSTVRKSFGEISLDPIIATVKKSNALGFVCEEVATASSLTM